VANVASPVTAGWPQGSVAWSLTGGMTGSFFRLFLRFDSNWSNEQLKVQRYLYTEWIHERKS
jgi:hypothetical protein